MTVILKCLLCALLLTTLFGQEAKANTYNAASCAESDVAAAVAKASNGDTVTIPACSVGVSWTTGLTVTGGITLIGQGAGNTVILDNTSKGDSNCQGTTSLIVLNLSSNLSVRISGMTITGAPAQYNCGESANHIQISGVSHQVRIDHITFNLFVTAVNMTGDTWGVIDHNTFNEPSSNAPAFATEVHHDAWQGVGAYGDNSWAQPDTLGQAGAVYIENNTYSWPNTTYFPVGCFDTEAGGRLVFRFNTGCPFVGMHGLDSSGRWRSGRQYEVYGNTFTAQTNPNNNMYTGIFLRGGTGMVFNNSFDDISGTPYITLMQVNSYRDTSGYAPWGPSGAAEECDGRSPFDTNTGTVYATGNASGSSSLDSMIANGSPGWLANQWAPNGTTIYSLVDTTQGWASTIVSNTSNTIVTAYQAQTGQGLAHNWTSGDSFQILRASACMDQIGRGAGAYVSGTGGPGNAPTPTQAVNQASDPLYEWLNNHNGTNQSAIINNNSLHVVQNRDYYDWTASFTGTGGVGTGTLAARPTTCTTGVAYWATDQGNWNQSGSGGQGELFVCTATNTWSLYYTPYTYPHPLTLGSTSGTPPSSGTPLVPPSNLTGTVQ
jgi:hypothetical protein